MNSSSLRRTALPAVAVLLTGVTLSACGNNNSSSSSGGGDTLNGGGATSQAIAQQTWRADYQKANSGTTINYEEVGSGTGVTNFTQQGVLLRRLRRLPDDRPDHARPRRPAAADAIEVPTYVSPIAVVFNLKGVDSLNLVAETIADIFNGTITKWNDPAIAAAQPRRRRCPSTAITTVHRSDESGTTFNFTDYLNKASDGAWTDAGQRRSGRATPRAARAPTAPRAWSGVVTDTDGTIGYADDQRHAGDLGVASIKVGSDLQPSDSAAGAAKVLALSKPAPGRRPRRHGDRHRPDHDRQGRPTRCCWRPT